MIEALRRPWLRAVLVAVFAAAVVALVWWRGPEWNVVRDAFTAVRGQWIAAAIGLNLASVVARSLAWNVVINQSMPPPHPRVPLVFSAFCVGLLANAVLPGRIGELARVAVLTRRMRRPGVWATLVGSVFAHRVFDLVPSLLLILYVLLTARIPDWAVKSLIVVICIGVALFGFGLLAARRHHRLPLDGLGAARRLVAMARHGLGVLHAPLPALGAALLQIVGWTCQLFAVYTAMRAFHIEAPLPAAGLVLVLMNVATIFPLWPGNIGLVQAAVALPLVEYGIQYAHGFAFGIGLQAIEASVGVGIGLLFLAREGLSFATLRRIPEPPQVVEAVPEPEPERPRARIPG